MSALQVATTDVSDRSAVALDRAAMVAAKMAPARAPAALAAAMAPAPFGTSEVVNGFYAANPGAATSFQVPSTSAQDIMLGTQLLLHLSCPQGCTPVDTCALCLDPGPLSTMRAH